MRTTGLRMSVSQVARKNLKCLAFKGTQLYRIPRRSTLPHTIVSVRGRTFAISIVSIIISVETRSGCATE